MSVLNKILTNLKTDYYNTVVSNSTVEKLLPNSIVTPANIEFYSGGGANGSNSEVEVNSPLHDGENHDDENSLPCKMPAPYIVQSDSCWLAPLYNGNKIQFGLKVASTDTEESVPESEMELSPYYQLSHGEAEKQAENDKRLEPIKEGEGWRINVNDFKVGDIPYARVGTAEILDWVCKEAKVKLIVTSALGTKKSQHSKRNPNAQCSHYNPENPKLDFRNQGSNSEEYLKKIQSKLKRLEYNGVKVFSRVSYEPGHLDVQISDEAYKMFAQSKT